MKGQGEFFPHSGAGGYLLLVLDGVFVVDAEVHGGVKQAYAAGLLMEPKAEARPNPVALRASSSTG